jgi:prophage antirepressor-like protein
MIYGGLALSAIAQVFEFGTRELRTTVIDDEPWFVATDVCTILEFRMASDALRNLEADEKGYAVVRTPGGDQRMSIVSESGLYALIFRSRTAGAKKFRRWVTSEVLPAIRKTGSYEIAASGTTLPAQISNRELALMVIAEADRADAAETKVSELEPKAAQADHHRAADGIQLVGDFANELKAWAKRECGVKVLHDDVWAFLGDIGLLIRGNTARHNHPTAFAVERDFVRVKTTEFETSNHGLKASHSPRLTPDGAGWAWDRAVKRIRAHGSLANPKAIEGA